MQVSGKVPNEWKPLIEKAMKQMGVGDNLSRYLWLLIWQNLNELGLLGKNGQVVEHEEKVEEVVA
ncbi:hypothetical protein DRP05_01005 [Archaeoglobales archaeon]|nr:MAG: hypothetical protein DRP05_01005 [Archaeoglobales archaeon]